jgi:hypothetical protein
MPAKTPSKGKKAAAPKAAAPKKSASVKKPVVAEEEPADELDEEGDEDEDLDDDEDEEAEEAPRAKAATPAPKKPAAPAAARPKVGDDAPAVVPARRLTPEAKARVNEMVKKGMSLSDALKAAAAWETFVAPVKDEPAKLVQGRSEGGPRSNFSDGDELPERDDDDEPAADAED